MASSSLCGQSIRLLLRANHAAWQLGSWQLATGMWHVASGKWHLAGPKVARIVFWAQDAALHFRALWCAAIIVNIELEKAQTNERQKDQTDKQREMERDTKRKRV